MQNNLLSNKSLLFVCRLHVMSGCVRSDDKMEDLENTYISNMQEAANRLQQVFKYLKYLRRTHVITFN